MNPIAHVDQNVMQAVADHRVHWMTIVARDVMWAGTITWSLLVIGCAVFVVVAAVGAWRVAITAVAAVLIASAVVAVLKQLIERPRPPAHLAIAHVAGYSMPSSEAARTAAASAALLVAIAWSSRRQLLVCVVVLVAANVFIGWCVVYLGGHWPSDVVVGWLVGGTIGTGCGLVARRYAARGPTRAEAALV